MFTFLARLLLKLSPIGSLAKRIPAKAWLYIAIAAALVLGFVWHQHIAHRAISDAYAKGKNDEAEHVLKQAQAQKVKIDAMTSKISKLERGKNDAENRRISDAADALRVRGPGRAVCPQPAAAPGRHEPSSGSGATAVDRLPDAGRIDLIGVPFPDAVEAAKQADLNRAEVLSWRDWYAKIVKAWPH